MYRFQRRRLLGSTTSGQKHYMPGGRIEVILLAFHVLCVWDSGLAVSPATLLLGGRRPRSYIAFDEQSDLEAAWLLNAKCVVSPCDSLGCLMFAMKLGLYTGTWIFSDALPTPRNAYSILCLVSWRSLFKNPTVLPYIIPASVTRWKSHAKPLEVGEYFYG